jgi:hydrogenase maturation protease
MSALSSLAETRAPELGRETLPQAAPTLVLGLGNELRGDDGIGPAVIRELAERPDLPPGVTVLDGGLAGVDTILLLKDAARAIIVDAADQGLAPGEWRRVPVAMLIDHAIGKERGSAHSSGLAQALALGQALGSLPPHLVVYAIQPERVDFSPGLSDALHAAIPSLCQAIISELRTPTA